MNKENWDLIFGIACIILGVALLFYAADRSIGIWRLKRAAKS